MQLPESGLTPTFSACAMELPPRAGRCPCHIADTKWVHTAFLPLLSVLHNCRGISRSPCLGSLRPQ